MSVQQALEWAFGKERAQLELPERPDLERGQGQGFGLEYVLMQRAAGSCQQRCPFFHAACFKLIDSLMCSFGGFNQTSLMGCQLRVARLFQRFGMSRLACSYTWWRLSNIC